MLPGAFNQPIVVGKPFEIQVQLLDSHNNTVSRGGVAVYLTQTVYTPLGHANPKSQIDGNKPGKLAVAYTNSQGLATFKIVGAKPSTIPVTFSSHLFDKSAGYVYGSGGYLNVTFVG
jgi:hypothetical protein